MLLVEKRPKFLSASSLKMFEHQPITFYLRRMAPDPLPKEPQNYGAALGTAFDAYVKIHIMNNILFNADIIRERLFSDIFDPLQKEYCVNKTVEELLLLNIDKQHAECIPLGKMIADYYIKTPAFKSLDIVDIEIHKYTNIGGVPIYMKLDATVRTSGVVKPFDLKTTSSSPAIGYYKLFDDGMLGSHKLYRPNISFKDINSDWNDQLWTYGQGLSPKVDSALIHQVCISNKIRIAEFVGTVDENNLTKRFSDVWAKLQTNTFIKVHDRLLLEIFAAGERWY